MNTATYYQGSGIFYDNVEFGRETVDASLDINPGDCPNTLSRRPSAELEVALLGDLDLDVYNVDIASLRLEGVPPTSDSYEDVATPYDGDLCGCTTAEDDGYLDLVLSFNATEVIEAVGPTKPGDYVLTLTGTLLDGTVIEAQDCIVIGRGR
jgi:hypothetical protein